MATPRGAVPRDIEQRLRNLEQRCADLASRVLAQRKLEVSEGDFVVRGGGSIVNQHPDGTAAVVVGAEDSPVGWDYGRGIQVFDGAGHRFFRAVYNSRPGAEQFSFIADGSVPSYCDLSFNELTLTATANGALQYVDPFAGSFGLYWDATGFTFSGCPVMMPSLPTTSSAANVRVDTTTWALQRSTSSRRYKQDVETAQVDPDAVLTLEPRTWRDRAEVEADPDTEQRHVGFIAEELDEAGLGQFVEYDDQGRPDAIQYDRLSAALLVVAKRQAAQIDALAARLDALEAA